MQDLTPKFNLIPMGESVISGNEGLIEKVGGTQGLGGRLANTVSSAINEDGNLVNEVINSQLDTDAKQILGEFTFGASGAIKIATDDNNGLWLSPTGILAKKAGNTTFAITTDGTVTIGGGVSKTFTSQPTTPYSVGDLWAAGSGGDLKVCVVERLVGAYNAADWALATGYQTAGQVTTIVGNTVTTGFVNALAITVLGTVTAGAINGITITGGTIRTNSGTTRVEMSGSNNALEHYVSGILRTRLAASGMEFWEGSGGLSSGIFLGTAANQLGMAFGGTTYLFFDTRGIVPASDNAYDLGTSLARWNDLYIGGNAFIDSKLKIPVGTNMY